VAATPDSLPVLNIGLVVELISNTCSSQSTPVLSTHVTTEKTSKPAYNTEPAVSIERIALPLDSRPVTNTGFVVDAMLYTNSSQLPPVAVVQVPEY
jgi:hypothetical protein